MGDSTSRDLEQQISFARHNFDNLQSLIRFSDTKAAAIVTIVIFLAASGLQVAKDAIPFVSWRSYRYVLASVLALFAGVIFLGSFGLIIVMAQNVLRPRGARHYRLPKAGVDFMWQDHVISHQTNEAYGATVKASTPELILRNVTDQVFELATISKEKMDALVKARLAIWCAFTSWVVGVITCMLLLRWK